MTLTTEPNAIVVPTAAVQTGQQGDYVFVVKPDKTVETAQRRASSGPAATTRSIKRAA